MSLVSRTRRRRLRRPCPERFVASGGASRPRRSGPPPQGGSHDAAGRSTAFVLSATRSRPPRRRRGHRPPRRSRRSGACRRDLHVALHGEDHRAGGLRLCLDARRRGHRRRLRQARHGRRATEARRPSARSIKSVSVGGRHEAHHGGFTDDRRQFWAAASTPARSSSSTSRAIPAQPKLVQDHRRLRREERRRRRAAHASMRCPGRMLITGLSNDKDQGGRTALVEYNNDGKYIATHWLPTTGPAGAKARRSPTVRLRRPRPAAPERAC